MTRFGPNRGRTLRWAVGALLAAPIAWSIWASLQPIDRIYSQDSFTTGSVESRWRNYSDAWTRLPLGRHILNSLLITTAATLGTVLTSSMAGYAFAKLQWRGREFCFWLVLTALVLPSQALLIGQFLVFDFLGWVNTYKPLIVPGWLGGTAFYVFLFRQFFRSLPTVYDDAARLDGCTHWQTYRHVMLPLSRPIVAAVVAMSAVHHWQSFIEPLVYLSDYRSYTVAVGLRMLHSIEGSWANLIMAASLITLIPPLAVVLIVQRRLVRSIDNERSSER